MSFKDEGTWPEREEGMGVTPELAGKLGGLAGSFIAKGDSRLGRWGFRFGEVELQVGAGQVCSTI